MFLSFSVKYRGHTFASWSVNFNYLWLSFFNSLAFVVLYLKKNWHKRVLCGCKTGCQACFFICIFQVAILHVKLQEVFGMLSACLSWQWSVVQLQIQPSCKNGYLASSGIREGKTALCDIHFLWNQRIVWFFFFF